MTDIRIRTATPADAEALLHIYAPYVTDTTVTFEYHVPTAKEFSRRIEATLQKYPYLVAETEDFIAGYAYASAFKSRAAYDWAVETSIYLHPHFHGKGIGKMLYTALEDALQKQHVHSLNACITYPNDQSISFHEKMDYHLIAHFHECGYKFGKWLDVVWMEKHLPVTCPPQPFIPYPHIL